MTLKKLIQILQIEYAVYLTICALLIVLYETNILAKEVFVGDLQFVYILEVVGVFVTIGFIPLAIKSFSIALEKFIKPLPPEKANKSYLRWSEIRLGLLFVVVLLSISIYYTTGKDMGYFCGIAGFFASLYCLPFPKRIQKQLEA